MANLENVSLTSAKVYVAPKGEIAELKKDLSNAVEVMTACDALITANTAKRMASVIDVKLTIGQGTAIKVDTDDEGTILNANTPEAKVTGSWYEAKDVEAIQQFLNVKSVAIAKSWETPASKVFGQKIVPTTIPDCVILLEGQPDENWKKEYIYLLDSAFTGELVMAWIDYVRAGSPEATPFEFTTNKNGAWLVKKEQ